VPWNRIALRKLYPYRRCAHWVDRAVGRKGNSSRRFQGGDRSGATRELSNWVDLRQSLPASSPLNSRIARLQSQLKLGNSPISTGTLSPT
jgi:hypothetical protein